MDKSCTCNTLTSFLLFPLTVDKMPNLKNKRPNIQLRLSPAAQQMHPALPGTTQKPNTPHGTGSHTCQKDRETNSHRAYLLSCLHLRGN